MFGQAGIGSAFRSTVEVKSFSVAGEETEPPPPALKPLQFEYDETHIIVPKGKLEDAVKWYSEHLGLHPTESLGACQLHPTLEGQLMMFSHDQGVLYLVTVEDELSHFKVNYDTQDAFHFYDPDGNRINVFGV